MNRVAEEGLEMKPSTKPEVVPQPDGHMYYMGGVAPSDNILDQPNQSNQSDQPQGKGPSRSRAIWVLGGIAVVCLAVAIGAGLGAGLAAQHKSTLSSSSSGAPITIIQTSSAPVTITQSADLTTITPTLATLPSLTCPAANGSTYVATNKPLPTIAPQLQFQVTNTSFSFEILCNTTYVEQGSMIDLQIITNVSTLNACLDECALYDFRTRQDHFPAYACTAVAWGTGVYQQFAGFQSPVCWLKANVTLASPNQTDFIPNYDGAVLLGV